MYEYFNEAIKHKKKISMHLTIYNINYFFFIS